MRNNDKSAEHSIKILVTSLSSIGTAADAAAMSDCDGARLQPLETISASFQLSPTAPVEACSKLVTQQ
jgi:hypothetical protein